jgi:hypothetical protein
MGEIIALESLSLCVSYQRLTLLTLGGEIPAAIPDSDCKRGGDKANSKRCG